MADPLLHSTSVHPRFVTAANEAKTVPSPDRPVGEAESTAQALERYPFEISVR